MQNLSRQNSTKKINYVPSVSNVDRVLLWSSTERQAPSHAHNAMSQNLLAAKIQEVKPHEASG